VAKFADSMSVYAANSGYNIRFIRDFFDWKSLGQAVVVDVGGSRGHVASKLAQEFPQLRLVVQDSASTIDGALNELPVGIQGRVSFEAHDFFEPQPRCAEVYYFRWVFHNWSDKYAKKILQNLIPSLRTDAIILIQDVCMDSQPNQAHWKAKDLW
jgi:trans-aconitate methyltransferase